LHPEEKKTKGCNVRGHFVCVKATVMVFYLQVAGTLGRYSGRTGNCTLVKNHGTEFGVHGIHVSVHM
jgi:hypothetical protein